MASYSQPLDGDIEINPVIEVNLDGIIDSLVGNQTFLNKLRDAILIDARRKGNSFGQWAQSTAPTSGTQRRLH
jgi:hypothetical protein